MQSRDMDAARGGVLAEGTLGCSGQDCSGSEDECVFVLLYYFAAWQWYTPDSEGESAEVY